MGNTFNVSLRPITYMPTVECKGDIRSFEEINGLKNVFLNNSQWYIYI